jgi:hypothetical protein
MIPRLGTQGELDSRVGAITSHIVRRLADAAVEDMRARYDLGRVLHTLRHQDRRASGTGVLRLLAHQLGVDPSALRRYAQVSDVIAARELDWLMHLRNARGEPLTWSHVEILARVRSPERRRVLAASITREGLSVRALSQRLRAER